MTGGWNLTLTEGSIGLVSHQPEWGGELSFGADIGILLPPLGSSLDEWHLLGKATGEEWCPYRDELGFI